MILDIIYGVLLVAGALFFAAAVIAFLRLGDPLARLHAVGVAGTAGFGLIVLARIVEAASVWAMVEYLIILVLGAAASATVAQGVAWAARTRPEQERTEEWPREDRGRRS
ncbi:cation:proton antiporter [Caenispirillum salinarum]|uniref:cation:proton antiporter n=1 Tax=Caenispirillum salinarum TaxID=859058 RepID=UPI00385110A4